MPDKISHIVLYMPETIIRTWNVAESIEDKLGHSVKVHGFGFAEFDYKIKDKEERIKDRQVRDEKIEKDMLEKCSDPLIDAVILHNFAHVAEPNGGPIKMAKTALSVRKNNPNVPIFAPYDGGVYENAVHLCGKAKPILSYNEVAEALSKVKSI
ncbi:MAG: hypothetical protein ABIG10_04070 [bacterium]